MALLDLFKRTKREKEVRHTFTDEDREKAKTVKLQQKILNERLEFLRRMQQQKQLKQEIRMLEEDLQDNDDEDYEEEEPLSMDDKLLSLLEKVISGKKENKDMNTEINQQNLTDDDLNNLLQSMPNSLRKELKKKTPEEIKKLAGLYYPDLNPSLVDKIIPLL